MLVVEKTKEDGQRVCLVCSPGRHHRQKLENKNGGWLSSDVKQHASQDRTAWHGKGENTIFLDQVKGQSCLEPALGFIQALGFQESGVF